MRAALAAALPHDRSAFGRDGTAPLYHCAMSSALTAVRALAPIILLFAVSIARAQDAAPPLEEIVITGEYPGPGLWTVTRAGDASGHRLLIVGEPWALPKRMRWRSRDIEAAALASQEILRDSSVTMEPDEKIGFFRGMTLVPAMLEARRNPDDEKLADVLPGPLYARWLEQKRLYLGRAGGVEKWRPIFAADKLRHAAFEELELHERGFIWQVIGDLAKKHKIAVTEPKLKFTIRRDEVRAKIKAFSRESLADMECFATTLELTEALARRDVETARARAWATADLETLTALPPLPSPFLPCAMAVMNSQVAREVIPRDIAAQVEKLWLDAARKALAANQTTLAVVQMSKLLRTDGYLAQLEAAGYTVAPPQ